MSGFRLFCDGACRGNPGPAAIGAVLYNPKGEVVFEISEAIGHATNNEAEYRALISGIERTLNLPDFRGPNPPELGIRLDSQLVVRQVTGQYKVKNARMKPLYKEVQGLLAKLPEWEIRHVPREENSVADGLANAAYS